MSDKICNRHRRINAEFLAEFWHQFDFLWWLSKNLHRVQRNREFWRIENAFPCSCTSQSILNLQWDFWMFQDVQWLEKNKLLDDIRRLKVGGGIPECQIRSGKSLRQKVPRTYIKSLGQSLDKKSLVQIFPRTKKNPRTKNLLDKNSLGQKVHSTKSLEQIPRTKIS